METARLSVRRPARAETRRGQRRRRRSRLTGLRSEIPGGYYGAAAVLSFGLLIVGWQWVSHTHFVNPVFLPTPLQVVDTAGEILRGDTLLTDVRMSFLRVTEGFLLSAILALPIGLMMGAFRIFEGFAQPLTEFIRYVPVPALIPLLMIFFGIGEMSKVMLIFVGTFFQLVLMVADEVRRVDYDLLQVSYTLGARTGEVIQLVLFRAALPGIFDALRLCNGWAWTYLIIAELVAANEGLGFRILKFSRYIQTPKIWVYLVILGVIGLGLDFLFRRFNARVFAWADTTKR
jgi:NitT/TauT family transport system permease protein